MPPTLPNRDRDTVLPLFRQRICDKLGVAPFAHQAAWWLASDGYLLTPDDDPEGYAITVSREGTVKKRIVPRADGPARVLGLLAAFKTGKSYGAGIWASAFACVPNAKVVLIGMEYDLCSPEFEYILEALISERGMNMKYTSMQNRPRDGKMWLTLDNGMHYETRSWERRESLKGKEVDCYIACETYQFPGLEVYTSINQNLRAREGYFVAPTTPDRPWVEIFYQRAQDNDPAFNDWFCLTDIGAEHNPFTFDQKAKERDRQIMTREKFAIAYEGRLGTFVGRVYNYRRGERVFTPRTHPQLFDDQGQVCVPDGWEVVQAADTGTFYTALWVAFDPEGTAFVLKEAPNYRYVAGRPERDEMLAIPGWAALLKSTSMRLKGRSAFWADQNSQFKMELAQYSIMLQGNKVPFEARTEIAREYVQHNRIWFAEDLDILLSELEWAEWPEDVSSSGKFARLKTRDHTLDCLEHILSRRPHGEHIQTVGAGSWLAGQLGKRARPRANVHLA